MPKALNISCVDACNFKELPENTIMISINQEDEPNAPLLVDRKDPRVLTLRFLDITGKVNKNGQMYEPMSRSVAHEIFQFIDAHSGKDVIIHCAAGIARSGSVALFLHLCLGYELKPNFWFTSNPNPFVLGRLISEFHLRKHHQSQP